MFETRLEPHDVTTGPLGVKKQIKKQMNLTNIISLIAKE